MICLTQAAKLDEIISKQIPVLIIFTSPQKIVPQQSLLQFFYSYESSKPLHDHIFIFSIIDQTVYERFQIQYFPQVVIVKGNQVLFSFIGYNREKSIEAINILSEELGLGRIVKKLNISKSMCRNKHSMSLVSQINERKYKNGCFYCRSCDMMSHVEIDKPILACFQCNQFHCYQCSHQNLRI